MHTILTLLLMLPGSVAGSTNATTATPAPTSTELLRPIDARTSSLQVVSISNHSRQMWMEVTAYCACTKCCGPHACGLTASGRAVSYNAGRFAAADTAILPFGTKLIVPGYNTIASPIEVIDRGSAIKGYRLDVFFPTHEAAMQWGRRWIQVTVRE